jgi:hypothetical protein
MNSPRGYEVTLSCEWRVQNSLAGSIEEMMEIRRVLDGIGDEDSIEVRFEVQ